MANQTPTSIKLTPEEREALDFLREELGQTSDASVRRLSIIQYARKLGWRPLGKKKDAKKSKGEEV